MTYAPSGGAKPVVGEGEFVFAAAHLDHGHIFAQCKTLIEAGGTLKYVHDPDPVKVDAFRAEFPRAETVDEIDRILDDAAVHLVAAAAIPCERGPLGLRVMDAGKDYFTDKSPFTTLDQLEEARKKVNQTGRKYMVYYGERLHNESAWHAGELVRQGVLGEVVHMEILAPHRLSLASRPSWFFEKEKYGGILTDIGSHQVEQFLYYTGRLDVEVSYARVANVAHPEKPGLEDFGEACFVAGTGASCYCRVDWFTPDGQSVWGDGRSFIIGTKGTMEIRKYTDLARDPTGDIIFLTDGQREEEIPCAGRIGFPFFGRLILDVLNRTENAMTQEHAFKAAELCMRAQALADGLPS